MEAAAAAGSPCAAPLSDAEALRFFDERVRWQVAQFDALQGVEARHASQCPNNCRLRGRLEDRCLRDQSKPRAHDARRQLRRRARRQRVRRCLA